MAKKSVQLSGVAVAQTELCSIDPERGVLMYRGYDIADLAEHATYEEVAYLLLEGELPAGEELEAFEQELAAARELPRAVQALIDGNPRDGNADGDAAHGRLAPLVLRPRRGGDRPRERAA
jgi:2-methylcitrate synthase